MKFAFRPVTMGCRMNLDHRSGQPVPALFFIGCIFILTLSATIHVLIAFLFLDHFFPFRIDHRPVSTLVTAEDGTPLRAFADEMGIWRYPATTAEVSPLYLEALIHYEDRWFYRHPGINPLAIIRAMGQNIKAGRIVSGGSTLTMQVARIMTLPPQGPPSWSPNSDKTDVIHKPGGMEERERSDSESLDVEETEVPPPDRPTGMAAGAADGTADGTADHEKRRTIRGKLHQLFRALQLERHFTKDEILSLYLTHAPFGSNIEGVRTAAYTFLGKDAKALSHAEAALLAVLPQAPSFYRPDRHPERARNARDKVLDRLSKQGVWSEDVIRAAKKEPVVALRYHAPIIAPLAARRLHFAMPDEPLIPTTLNFDLQVHLEEIVKQYVSALLPSTMNRQSETWDQERWDQRSLSSAVSPSPPLQSTMQSTMQTTLSGAVLVLDAETMEIKAYIGSADFTSRAGRGHVDMIQALRSPGSTLKPFLYGAAMDSGLIHSHSLLVDAPRFKADYAPENFTGEFMGPVSATEALRQSLNVPAVQLLEAYGPHRFFDRLRHAGITLQFQGKPNLSMILGGVGISLESLVSLYTALVREGVAAAPVMIKKNAPDQGRFLLSPGAAFIVSRMLEHPMPGFERMHHLTGGTQVVWKTGTSYGFRDAWAFGIMGEFVAGVWVGRPDGTAIPGQYGAVTALPLLERILETLPTSDFRKKIPQPPDTVTQATICWPLGGRQSLTEPQNCMKKMEAWILDGQVPMTLTREDQQYTSLLKWFWIDENGERAQPSCGGIEKISVALWPQSVSAWLPPQWRNSRRIPKASLRCPGIAAIPGSTIQIISIGDGSLFTRPPGALRPSTLPLIAQGVQGKVYWFLNRNMVGISEGEASFALSMPGPGRYQLVAADESGNSDMVHFSVLSSD